MEQISENANYHAASQHDEIIGNLLKPSWLAEGELRDNIWVLRMHNPKHVRNATQRVNFDTPIAPNNYRTTDYECRHDLITAKLICYYMLMPAPLGDGRVSLTGVKRRVELYFEYVRWRNRQGIPRNSLMTEVRLEELVELLRTKGARAVRAEGAVQLYLEKLKASGEPLPSYLAHEHGREYRRLSATGVARALGLNSIRALPEQERDLLSREARAQNVRFPDRQSDAGKVWVGRRERSGDNVTIGLCAELLFVPTMLYRFRKRLSHDPLIFRPFKETKAHGIARNLALKPTTRTPFARRLPCLIRIRSTAD
jgi:hypothetical protein